MLPAAQDINGLTYIIVGTPPANMPFVAGLAVSNTGQIYVSPTASAMFANGFMVDSSGALIADTVGTPLNLINGIARTNTGVLLYTLAAPATTDVFISGLRVTFDGVLCCTVAAPP